MIEGFIAFLNTALLVLTVHEVSLFAEEILKVKLEFRKGFTSTGKVLPRLISRHLLQVLRLEGGPSRQFWAGFRCLPPFLAAGLLPAWNGEIFFALPHTLWIFWCLLLLAPSFSLVSFWATQGGKGWPSLLTSAERALGSSAVIFMLGVTLVAVTGIDTFAGFDANQTQKGWTIFQHPSTIILLFSFMVISLFVSSQSLFSSSKKRFNVQEEGWSVSDFLTHLWRTLWSLFMVNVFLGGEPILGGVLRGPVFVLKASFLNVLTGLLSWFFIRMREDQTESFILWILSPLSALILMMTILFSGVGS